MELHITKKELFKMIRERLGYDNIKSIRVEIELENVKDGIYLNSDSYDFLTTGLEKAIVNKQNNKNK